MSNVIENEINKVVKGDNKAIDSSRDLNSKYFSFNDKGMQNLKQ